MHDQSDSGFDGETSSASRCCGSAQVTAAASPLRGAARELGIWRMKSLWDELRPLLLHIAAFSFFINLLFLVPAIFTLAGVRSRHHEQQPRNAAGSACRRRRRAGDPAVARLRAQSPAEPARQHHRRAAIATGGERHRRQDSARTAQRETGRHPRRRGPAQCVCREWLDRGVRCALGARVRAGDLDLPPRVGHRRRLSPRSSCWSWRGSTIASAAARSMACRRMGAALPSTWRARCATRRCCRRSV